MPGTGAARRAPTAIPAEFAGLFATYAGAVSAPGGPLDGDTVRPTSPECASTLRGWPAWPTAIR